MDTEQCVKRDERTVAVENASYKWAYYFLAFAVLVDAYFRYHHWNETVWDLVVLACISSVIQLVHVVRHKAWTSNWPWKRWTSVIIFAGCVAVAVLVYAITRLSIHIFP